jgi:hypothetical protein
VSNVQERCYDGGYGDGYDGGGGYDSASEGCGEYDGRAGGVK